MSKAVQTFKECASHDRESELKPCPFCGVNLMFMRGKRVNRYYKGEPTVYQHPQKDNCILGKYGKEVQKQLKSGRWRTLKPYPYSGQLRVQMWVDSVEWKRVQVSKLVADAFMGGTPPR